MILHVESTAEEVCGFMFGLESGARTITRVSQALNATGRDKRKEFAIDPLEYLKAEDFALHNGVELLGIYHSHPDHAAVPSEQDRIAAQPFFSYVILSVKQHRFASIRSWRLNNDRQFEEETITHIYNTPS